LRRALKSCREQRGVKLEILVYDDASTDDTIAMVKSEFPEVRLVHSSKRVGLIVLRNQGFDDATTPFVFSIDDDAWFSGPETIAAVIRHFDFYPMVAAFALHYIEPERTACDGFMTPAEDGSLIRNYIGCAHAIRRDVVRKLTGYRSFLVHQGEERDLCIRLLDAGYEIRYIHSPAIVHQPSIQRDRARMSYYGFRNTFLFDLLNVPFPYLLFRLPLDIVQLFRYKISVRSTPHRIGLILVALLASIRYLPRRNPVSRATYNRYRTLPSHGPAATE